jgi:hypothetical protein
MMRRPDDSSQEVAEPDVGAVTEVPREVLIGELLGLCDGFFGPPAQRSGRSCCRS